MKRLVILPATVWTVLRRKRGRGGETSSYGRGWSFAYERAKYVHRPTGTCIFPAARERRETRQRASHPSSSTTFLLLFLLPSEGGRRDARGVHFELTAGDCVHNTHSQSELSVQSVPPPLLLPPRPPRPAARSSPSSQQP